MAIRRVRIDYTVYPPKFDPDRNDPCWDHRTIAKARLHAKRLGRGARVYRNFNQTNKRGHPLGDWWAGKAWKWNGTQFISISGTEKVRPDK